MSSSRFRKEKEKLVWKTCLFCVLGFVIGYVMLNHISTMEKPPLGITFNVVIGCTFIAVSLLVLVVTLKRHFFPKKRKKRAPPVFLEDQLNKAKEEQP
ncbi:MAG TPA: hypothetical protein VK528_09555 [Flavobacterium sp.]|nr:hypothetical protein [Flavobacterium sp.]